MNVEGISSVGGGYAGQGGSRAASPATGSASVVQETKKVEAAAAVSVGMQGKTFEISDPQAGRDNGQASTEQIRQAVDTINKNTQNEEAVFGIHEGTNRVTIKIVDKKTKEVIKEFPPEKTLDMIAKVWEMAGIMVDERR